MSACLFFCFYPVLLPCSNTFGLSVCCVIVLLLLCQSGLDSSIDPFLDRIQSSLLLMMQPQQRRYHYNGNGIGNGIIGNVPNMISLTSLTFMLMILLLLLSNNGF